MSCLYSSPEVKTLKSKASDFRSYRRAAWFGQASGAPNHGAVQFHRDFTVRRNQHGRVPQQRKPRPPAASIILLAKQAQVSCVSIQAQYQAFVRFAVRSSAALSAIALNWTCVLEPFTRGGLSL
jgi:hypothetical protein